MQRPTTRAGPTRSAAFPLAIACLVVSGVAVAHPEIELQIAELDREIAAHPGQAELYLRRGELHRIHQSWAEAEADFATARSAAPDLAVVDFHLGRMLLDAGRVAEAKETLDRFLAREPAHVEGLATRAQALAELGRHRAAAEDLTRAIAAVPESGRPKPSYYLDRARALERTGQLDEAVRGLDEGLLRLGQPVTLQLYAIELDLARDRYDAALARLDRIAAASERQESWLVRRAEILERAGRGEAAKQAYSDALAVIHALPAGRRSNRAVRRLEESATAALARLAASGPAAVPAEPAAR
jgi:tetratricopeptide (TPR) repeat protein